MPSKIYNITVVFILILYLFLIFFTHGKKSHNYSIESDPLLESMNDFAELQKPQSVEVNRGFPVDDRLYYSLKKCGNLKVLDNRMSEKLQPPDIEIYFEIGHFTTTFCRLTNFEGLFSK